MQLNNTDIHETYVDLDTDRGTDFHAWHQQWLTSYCTKTSKPCSSRQFGIKNHIQHIQHTCQPSMRFALLPHPHALDVGTTSTMEGEKTARRLKPPTGTRSVSTPITVIPSGSTFRQKRIMEKQFAGPQFVKDLGEQPCVLTVNGTTLNPIGKITF